MNDRVLENPHLPPSRARARRERKTATQPVPASVVTAGKPASQVSAPAQLSGADNDQEVLLEIGGGGDGGDDEAYIFDNDTPHDNTSEYDGSDADNDEGDAEPAPGSSPAARRAAPGVDRIAQLLSAIETLTGENAELRRELGARRNQDDAPADAPETPAERKARLKLEADPDNPALDAAADEFLGEHRPHIERLVDRRVTAKLTPLLRQIDELFDRLEGNLGTVVGATEESRQRSFIEAIRAKHADFDTLVKGNEPFAAFLKEQAPLMRRGVTVGMVLSQAWKDRDVDVTLDALDRFKARTARRATKREADATSRIDQFVQPPAPRGGGAPRAQPGEQLRTSQWNALRISHRRGDISREEFLSRNARFQRAAEEGRLVDDTAGRRSN